MPRKKPTNEIPYESKIQTLKDDGGISKATKNKRRSVENRFAEFVMNYKGLSLDQLIFNAQESIESRQELESILMAFFQSMKLPDDLDENGQPLPPMKNTCESYKSHLRMMILEKSEGSLDILNLILFKEYQVIYQKKSL